MTVLNQYVVIVFNEEAVVRVVGPFSPEEAADDYARTIRNAAITQDVEVHPVYLVNERATA